MTQMTDTDNDAELDDFKDDWDEQIAPEPKALARQNKSHQAALIEMSQRAEFDSDESLDGCLDGFAQPNCDERDSE